MNTELIGNRIKSRRKEVSISLQEIADKIGVNKSTIQRYESGNIKDIKRPVIDAIAEILTVNPLWLIGKTDNPTYSPEYIHATHLMNLYFGAVANWSEDALFNEIDTIVIREHFHDLLFRYKEMLVSFSQANLQWNRNKESLLEVYNDKTPSQVKTVFLSNELERHTKDLSDWVKAFPGFVTRRTEELDHKDDK